MENELPKGTRTRRQAVWLGVMCFAVASLAAWGLGLLGCWLVNPPYLARGISPEAWRNQVGWSLLLSLPLALLAGAISGNEYYRCFAGGHGVWAGAVLLCGFGLSMLLAGERGGFLMLVAIMFCVIHFANRYYVRKFSAHMRRLRWVYWGMLLFCILGVSTKSPEFVGEGLMACGVYSIFPSDSVVGMRVSDWMARGQIPPSPQPFQFSLLELLLFSVAVGGYALMLARFFQP